MSHRLYIVEGLPCSGKSSTAAYIAGILANNGKSVIHVDEGSGDHPADYEFHSFVSEKLLAELDADGRVQVERCGEREEGGYIVPLSCFEGELFERLLQYKIYDFLPWEVEMPLMLGRWQRFAAKAQPDAVYVFNCCFLQNPMCETMMRFGFDIEKSLQYIKQLDRIIAPLSPLVVYLKNDDIAQSVSSASREREGWLDSVIDYHANGAYGRSINAEGFDGLIACLEERQRRELDILAELSTESVIIDNPHRSWTRAYEKLEEAIN